MNRRAIAVGVGLSILAGSLLAGEPPKPPAPADWVTKLGSDEFREREAACKRLDELGPAALDALRPACDSDDPEVARRARELVARIERRLANEKTLAPTAVELAADNVPLPDVLADLAKQSGYAVTLAGEIGPARVTLRTGRVPFWEAVLKLCDAAGLRVAAVGGFVAPDSSLFARRADRPPLPSLPAVPQPGFKVPAQPGLPGPVTPAVDAARPAPPNSPTSVVLEARPVGSPKRPAAVYGAVLVEAFAVPAVAAAPDVSAVLLQVWPEPRLNWQHTRGVRVTRARDRADRALAAEPDAGPLPQVFRSRAGVAVVQQVNGNVVLLNPAASVTFPSSFTPNNRQAVVRLRTEDRPADVLREFAGAVAGSVRSGAEPVARVDLKTGEAVEADGLGGATMRATLGTDAAGKLTLTAELAYDPTAVNPAAPAEGYAPATEGAVRGGRLRADALGGTVGGSLAAYGVRVTDADGKPYQVSPTFTQHRPDRTGRHLNLRLGLALTPTAKGQSPPAVATFWATYNKPVEVPFALRDVPAAGK